MSNPNMPPAPRSDLPPRCNHLIERKMNSSISGTWHIDTALVIPERLLPHISDFDGSWNEDVQTARKERLKEIRKREREGGQRSSVDLPPLVEVRPNLMISSTNGAVKGNVQVVSSDGVLRPTTIVAQGTNGSVNLVVVSLGFIWFCSATQHHLPFRTRLLNSHCGYTPVRLTDL